MTIQPSEKGERGDPRVPLLRELADPIRIRVIDHLGNVGPATVSELGAELGIPLPQLSNHLKRLREARLVEVERSGRHAVYRLSDPGLQALLPVLDRITGRITPRPDRRRPVQSRTCYDHLAGRLGVSIFEALVERGAIEDKPDGTVALGPNAAELFGALGVDAAAIDPGRRRYAFECFDSTEHAPHLAGPLGDALAEGLAAQGWIELASDSREVRVTPAGTKGLKKVLGLA
jgi:DNA-binding transcriptional ArsR family regulator